MVHRISSRQNPVVKRFRDAARGAGDDLLLDGEHLVREALDSGIVLAAVAFTDALATGRLEALAAAVERTGAATFVVNGQVLAAMSPVKAPSGVVALAARPAMSIDDVFTARAPLVLMLGEVQDPGNVGAIVRAAEACGATGIVAAEGTADPFGWKALRGGMGSTLRLPIAAKLPLRQAIAEARRRGLRIVAATARDGTPLPECNLRGPSAILLGGEGPGLAPDIAAAADERVSIPMRAPVESLNVATAAALILYEASRQRGSFTSL